MKKISFHAIFTAIMVIVSFQIGLSTQEFIYDTKLQRLDRLEQTEQEFYAYKQKVKDSGLKFISTIDGSFMENRIKASVIYFVADEYDQYNSQAMKKFISDKILEYSLRYEHDPLSVLSLLYTESSLNPEVKQAHPDVVGMAGINYKVWGDLLTKEGIIYSKKDLKNVEVAIHSLCFVMDAMKKSKSESVFQSMWSYKGRGYDKTLSMSGHAVATNSFKVYKDMKKKADVYMLAMK